MQQHSDTVPLLHTTTLGLQLFETSPDCVKLLSDEGCVLAMNRNGMCAMEIDDFSRFAGAAWKSFWPAETHADIDQAIARACAGDTGHFKGCCPTAKGSPRWWDVIVTAIHAEDGRLDKLLAVSRDVTAAHQAGLELQASEARFRSLVTATSAIVWSGPASGRFETVQPGWSAYTGQSFEQYQGWGWLDAVHPEDRASTSTAWQDALRTRSVYQVRHRLRRADGQYRHMNVRGVPLLDAAGTVLEWVGVHTDISDQVEADAERERLLKEVQAANARMADVFRQAPAFMCVLSGPDHIFELINERYLQLVGNRDLVGQSVREALPEIAGQGYLELLDAVYHSGESFTGTDMPVMLQRHPGAALEQRYVDLVFSALRDADGNIASLLVHGVDQTDRKLAELELYESRERFAKIVHQAATGVVQMDPQGRITLANKKYCAMVGRPETELLRMSVTEVTAPESLAATRGALAHLAAGGGGVVLDKHYLHRDGTHVPATSSVNALRGATGEFQGLVAIVLDTTESRRAAEQLRASEERYRTLFESMDQGFAILEMLFDDRGNAADYRFLEMNHMFTRHTGLADAIGKTARELVPNLDQFWFDTYGRVALTGEAVRFENEAAAIGRWFDVYATRLGGAGSGKVAILFSDISERKRSEEQLRRLADDLAEAGRRKTEFLATLAHELRNPLAPIRNGLAVLRLSGDNAAAVGKVRDMMERQVGHMVHLIDDLLDIARISGGKLELKRERVDLKRVLASAVETSLPLIEASGHRLYVALPETPLMVDADVTRIAQVVANLLNNAAKYTPGGGRIDLRADVHAGMVRIHVSDTGVGIPAEALQSVFDMFKQVDRHVGRAQGGLGIGLSLVRRLVDMHGGSVTATSAGIGQGSSFVVSLPLAAVQEEPAPPSRQEAPRQAGSSGALRVLVVDDNVDAALTLSMTLEVSGHVTRIAHDGVQALAVAREFAPRIAFLDIGMPGMNGYQTASAMRATPGLEDITLVALTGWGTENDRRLAVEAGFDYHLTKPAPLQAVHDLLAQLAQATEGTPLVKP